MTPRVFRRVTISALLLVVGACSQRTTAEPSSVIPRPTITEHTRVFTVGQRVTDADAASNHIQSLDQIVDFVATLGPQTRITISGRDTSQTAAIRRALRDRLGTTTMIESRSVAPPSPDRAMTSIAVSWATVSVPGCPDWTGSDETSSSRLHSSNFGCATAQSMAAMLHDPLDLSTPTALGPADGTREALAIDRYRTDKVKQPTVGEGFSP